MSLILTCFLNKKINLVDLSRNRIHNIWYSYGHEQEFILWLKVQSFPELHNNIVLII